MKIKVTCYLDGGGRVSFVCSEFSVKRDGGYSYDGMLVDNTVKFVDASKIIAFSYSPAPFLGLMHYVRSVFYVVLMRIFG